uniref:Deoxyribodipyrimidine photo-lyase n=1 Tax=Cyprinus carpio TaxID=7962 RepID=A0A8C1MQH0_CYPCA
RAISDPNTLPHYSSMSANKRNLKRQREPADSAGVLKYLVSEIFCGTGRMTHIQYNFMLKGLREVAKECKSLDIQFHLLSGEPGQTLPSFVRNWKFGAVVTDFNPLRIPLQWIETIKKHLMSLLFRCFSHYYFYTSGRLEYGARTIRGKITKLLAEFLREIPLVDTHPHSASRAAKEVLSSLEVECSVGEVDLAQPGSCGGMAMLESFIDHHRNNPNCDALSHLSPRIHAGQLSAQRVVKQELVVRREPADNFCFYNHNYDNISGAYDWAKKTLQDHAKDCRQYLYTKEQLENAKTRDQLWNAAQRQLVLEGKMHGFLRMNWAKKILEWTASPEEALSIAVFLNDRLSLDGYVGCMWSICGIHDQGWAERPIFGKIRFMNYAGCKRKFDLYCCLISAFFLILCTMVEESINKKKNNKKKLIHNTLPLIYKLSQKYISLGGFSGLLRGPEDDLK